MTTYTDVFGNATVPPSEYGYQAVSLTGNTTFYWPYNAESLDCVAKIMDVTSSSVGLNLTLPSATEVSTGEDLLVRNVGGTNHFFIKDNDGNLLTQVNAGEAKYLYLTDNTTVGGEWGVIAYGVGTSTVDAASLIGYGIKAIDASLNQSHEVFPSATNVTIDDTYRSKVVVFTGGSGTCTLTSAVTLGNDFFFMLRNNGTGTLTIDPAGVETVDSVSSLGIQPGESLLLFCSGSAWYSVGYGRSVLYNFTQLVKDLTSYSGSSVTLSASEASNKLLTFTGSPASTVTVIVPNVVAVYYLLNSLSAATSVTVKTAAGSGVSVPQTQRVIAICDSTNVYSAQSIAASTTVSLLDGSSAAPALSFASDTDTGLFKYGTNGVGITSNGSEVAHFDSGAGNVITGALTTSSTLNAVGNFTVNTNKLSVTASNGNTTWASGATLNATGSTWTSLGTVTTADINGGTIDGTVIGGASAAAGSFTTLGCGAITSSGMQTINTPAGATALKIVGRSGGANESWVHFYRNDGTTLQGGILGDNTTGLSFAGPDGNVKLQMTNSALTTGSGITSLAFNAGNPSLNIGTGALTAGTGTFSGTTTLKATAGTYAGGALLVKDSTNSFTSAITNAAGVLYLSHDTTGASGVCQLSSTGLAVTGIVTPEADNTRTLGTGALRWSVVYAGTGTINTSDAREKTAVRALTDSEINASKQLSKEIGAYRWLSAVEKKGDDAREHIGLTVQRAIEIMEANNLAPMAYGFICYDQWDEVLDAEGTVTQVAGDRFSFRMDELNLFIARGFEARLAALESK